MSRFSEAQIRRYARHIILEEVGGVGQERLLDSKVLVIGAGGLGSPVLYYLAAAGVGALGIVDFDRVELSNLHRQILHTTDDLGVAKTASAQERLNALNAEVQVVPYKERIRSENALEIIEAYDVIVDGSDNFPTRYLVNDACMLLGKPLVYGSVLRFEGQVSVFLPGDAGPCYRCIFPKPPPPGAVPDCAEAGVFGVLPGLIGAIQATEVLKLLLGIGESLAGRLLIYDALGMTLDEVRIAWDPRCPVCGERPEIRELIDYEVFCGVVSESKGG
ncbi:MAG: molybdopterin-synthase adenylyltransferase MoeB [Candidatus Bipolaricaulia bacterium]